MPIVTLDNPVFISVDGAGRPNAGGTVGVYLAGTSFGTLATIYSDQVKTTELTNPVTLDAAGTKEIWYDVEIDIREKTSTGVTIRDTLNLDPNASAAISTGFNLAENGSFETDADTDGQPDSWTISAYVGSAIAITTDVVTDGLSSLEFNTGAAGSGGGTATSTKFAVTEGTVCSAMWSFYATHATTLNTFQIKWYDEDDVLQSTSTLTMPASGSVPTSWTAYTDEVTVDAAATQGEIVLTGISSGGSNLNSKAYFDGIKVVNMTNMVTLAGTQTLTNKTLTNPTVTTGSFTSPSIDQVVDSNSNEAIIIGTTASAVNEITVTNAATGNAPTISTSGDNTDIDLNITPKGVGAVIVGGITQNSVTSGITADVGSSQGDGVLTSEINEISTCANVGDAVTLPSAIGGQSVTVINNGANAADVFPASSDNLGAGVDTAESLSAGSTITYVNYDATNWKEKAKGDLVFISSATASTSTTVDFDNLIDGTYERYVVEVINATPVTNNVQFYIRVQTGGSTWQTGTVYQYSGTAGTFIQSFLAGTSNVTAEGGITGTIGIYDPSNTSTWTRIAFETGWNLQAAGNIVGVEAGGAYTATTAVTGIRFYFATDEIASGTFRLYGVSE